MGLYEHLPYANFHELNLDKIMEVVANIPSLIYDELLKALETFPIPDGSITTAKLATYAVTSAKIATNAVTSSKISDSAISATKLAQSAVTTSKIAQNAVTNDKIADSSISTAKIEDEAVTTDKLAPGSVTTAALRLSPQTLFSSNTAFSLTSGTTFQDVGDPFTISPGLYLAILYVRKGIMSGTANNQLVAARISADGNSPVTNGLEIRQYTGPAASSHVQSVVIRFTATTSLQMQAFQNSGQTNADMKFYFQVLKLSD